MTRQLYGKICDTDDNVYFASNIHTCDIMTQLVLDKNKYNSCRYRDFHQNNFNQNKFHTEVTELYAIPFTTFYICSLTANVNTDMPLAAVHIPKCIDHTRFACASCTRCLLIFLLIFPHVDNLHNAHIRILRMRDDTMIDEII